LRLQEYPEGHKYPGGHKHPGGHKRRPPVRLFENGSAVGTLKGMK